MSDTSTSEEKIKKRLDDLALDLAKHAALPGTLFPDKLDAFKALTAYHLGIVKTKKKDGEDKPNDKGETFDAIRQSIEASGG